MLNPAKQLTTTKVIHTSTGLHLAIRCTMKKRTMPVEKILPTVLIAIDIASACVYLKTGDWRRVVYWLAAAALTYTVTW
jgi:hypothetical protein